VTHASTGTQVSLRLAARSLAATLLVSVLSVVGSTPIAAGEVGPLNVMTEGSNGLNIAMLPDADAISPGEEAAFTIVIWNDGPEAAIDATFHDELPAGVWQLDLVNPDEDDACGAASGMDMDGPAAMTFDCAFGTLEPSSKPDAPHDASSTGKVLRVRRVTGQDECGQLANAAWADAANDERGFADASIVVACPMAEDVAGSSTVMEAGRPAPSASLPDTATGATPPGGPSSLAIQILVLALLAPPLVVHARSRRR